MEKGKVMMIIIIVLLVVLLGTVAAVSFYVLNLIKTQSAGTADEPIGGNTTKVLTVGEKDTVALGEEAITTNLQVGADGTAHIAKILVTLSYDNTTDESDAFATLLEENIMVARTVALGVISDCTFEDLLGQEGREFLADSIKSRLQEEFNTMLIVDVGFPEWLIP